MQADSRGNFSALPRRSLRLLRLGSSKIVHRKDAENAE
jgi:hypothetical protein